MSLPLPKNELPKTIRRFANPEAPEAARTMAARGLVPVKGDDLIAMLVQLAHDPVSAVSNQAKDTLLNLPAAIVEKAATAALGPIFLEGLYRLLGNREPVVGALIANGQFPGELVIQIAKKAKDGICERIAANEIRILQTPEIIEALYANPNTRMSTVDRLIELAARNGVKVNIPTFQQHVDAIQGQLIPEASDEALPGDLIFQEALESDNDQDAIDVDSVDGSEEVAEEHAKTATNVTQMTIAEKLRATVVGRAALRALLVRDPNKVVAMAAISSPRTTEAEAAKVAASKQVTDEVLRYIGNRRDWLGNYELKRNLVFNSKTPVGISMKFLMHLRMSDLKALARSKNVPASIRSTAQRRLKQRD